MLSIVIVFKLPYHLAVDCDGCGLSVHEACYGIQEPAGGSTGGASTASSACTEPWFCEVSGVTTVTNLSRSRLPYCYCN